MSSPPQPTDQGPPPFEPPVELISSFSTSIQTSVSQYENAKTPEEKAAALKAIQASSIKLTRATSSMNEQWVELNQRPLVNVAVRIALEMGLFEAIPTTGESITVAETAKKINAEEEFIFRIGRVLGAWEVLEASYSSSGVLSYSHTPLSRFLTIPGAKAALKNSFEFLLPAQMGAAPGYYQKYGFKSAEDSKNSPFTFAHGTQDKDFFDILCQKPEKLAIFNDAMTFMAVFGLRTLKNLYPFDQLEPNADGVVLVDVGGGKGQILKLISETYPAIKGKLVLEDLKLVLDGGVVVGEEVALQPYDFFEQIQPIKGRSDISCIWNKSLIRLGSNYFLKSILHDWPDKACIKILNNLAPAMKEHPHSKLLICDLILADQYPERARVIRDMNMMVLGGKERSLGQWHDLLGKAGFKILKVYGVGDVNSSIIEAVLDE
jgi:hypothetical protein